MSDDKHAFFRTRTRTRRLAMQAIYQWLVNQQNIGELLWQFSKEKGYALVDETHFKALVNAAVHKECHEQINECMEAEYDTLDPIEYALISIAAYEMSHCKDIDNVVAITEAIHLAKKFGNDNSYRFINGVLDCYNKKVSA